MQKPELESDGLRRQPRVYVSFTGPPAALVSISSEQLINVLSGLQKHSNPSLNHDQNGHLLQMIIVSPPRVSENLREPRRTSAQRLRLLEAELCSPSGVPEPSGPDGPDDLQCVPEEGVLVGAHLDLTQTAVTPVFPSSSNRSCSRVFRCDWCFGCFCWCDWHTGTSQSVTR